MKTSNEMTPRVPALFLALTVLSALLCGQTVAQTLSPKLLPFQARLTDQNGVAVSNGVRLVQFKIFGVPSGGSPIWAGELHRTTVNGGLVNVLLGTKTPFTGVDFDRQLYLEITVDINGDSAITLADPPMLPRQAVLPVVFAKEAADSRLLDGYDWSVLFGTNNPATGKINLGKVPNPPGLDAIGGVLPNAVLVDSTKTITFSPSANLRVGGPMSLESLVTLKVPADPTYNKQMDFTGDYYLFRDNVNLNGTAPGTRLWFDAPDNGNMFFGPRTGDMFLARLMTRSRRTDFITGTTGVDTITMLSGGKLGIGVEPAAKLDVGGDARVSGTMTMRSPDAAGASQEANRQFDFTGGYGIYRDHRHVYRTTDTGYTRLWIDAPQGGGFALGPRTSGALELTRIISDELRFESGSGKGVIIKNGAFEPTGPQGSTVGLRDFDGDVISFQFNDNKLEVYATSGGVTDYITSLNHNNAAKTFVIEHPDDSSKYLVHATLEGPESAVFYRGTAQLQDGTATVRLPAYFESLTATEGRTVQLTAIDGFDRLAVRSKDGQVVRAAEFEVISDNSRSEQVFMWEVKAVRKDVPALSVEVPKADAVVNAFGPYTFITPVR